jgi:hypothetical protein
MTIVGLKLALAVGCTAASLLVYAQRNGIATLPQPIANRLLLSAFIGSRLVPFLLVYVLLQLAPRSDVPVFYAAARHAMLGQVVYRDFWSPYDPLFAYLTALPLWVWNSPKAIVALMIGVEGLAWWLTYRYYRNRLGGRAQASALLYLLLPGPLLFCVLGGQEDVWMWAVAAGSLWGIRRSGSSFGLGVWLVGLLLVTKALGVLIVLPLLVWVPRRGAFMAGLLGVGLPVLAGLYWLTGTGLLTPLMFVSMPFAPNLWTVLAPLIGDYLPYSGLLSTLGLGAVLGLSGWAAWRLRRAGIGYDKALPLLWVLCYGFMMLVHKSSFGNYAFIFLLPLVLVVANWHQRPTFLVLLLLNLLVAVQPSYWWAMHTPLFTRPVALLTVPHLTEYAMEWGILLSVGFFVRQSFLEIKNLRQPVDQPITT